MIDEIFGWGWLVGGLFVTAYFSRHFYRLGGWAPWIWFTAVVPFWLTYAYQWVLYGDIAAGIGLGLFFASFGPGSIHLLRGGNAGMYTRQAAEAGEEERQMLLPFVRRYRWTSKEEVAARKYQSRRAFPWRANSARSRKR